MVKSAGKPSSRNADKKQKEKEIMNLTLKTLLKVKEKVWTDKRTERMKPDSEVKYFDLTEPRYSWLLPGWIAEERRMPSGRLYKYYYDQTGRQYRTLREVDYAWEKCGIIRLK